MSIKATSGSGKLTGYGQVVRKDGTIEKFTIDTSVSKEQSDKIEEHLQKQTSESQNKLTGNLI
tara:strand:+ start:449 stop:637 length:189 start_codon:yes stop_codon:yes gene_type:complete